MFPSDAKSANVQELLPPSNYANTATASNGAWVSTLGMVGTLLIIQDVGVAGGNVDGSLLSTANSNGAGNAALTFDDGNNFASTAGNALQAKTVDVNKSKGYIKYIATLGGASNIAVAVIGRPKESPDMRQSW
jgi:hypothetical protein